MLHLLNHLKNMLGQSVTVTTNAGLKALSLPKNGIVEALNQKVITAHTSQRMSDLIPQLTFLFLCGNICSFFTFFSVIAINNENNEFLNLNMPSGVVFRETRLDL